MKIVIINKSDSTGGAAVVSRRLMEALRQEGVEARMLVAEKLTDSPYVEVGASALSIKWHFVLERLKIYIANGLNRATLFKIDTGEVGLPLWKHNLVKEADAIFLNWVNQGMLSLKGVRKILKLGKPVVWTMHDMWCMTGICHHAGLCPHFLEDCGRCPLLGKKGSKKDLSFRVHGKKAETYTLLQKIKFVAVSSWLAGKARESSLLKNQSISVIPNAFHLKKLEDGQSPKGKIRILMGAARLDDPIKGLDTFRETSLILAREYPSEAKRLELVFFGMVKNPEAMEGFALPIVFLGQLNGEEEVAREYSGSDIVVSASSYETLPGTLVEAQAYGCIPVAFNRGGQADIIDNGITGFIVAFDENLKIRSKNLAEGIINALRVIDNSDDLMKMQDLMRESVEKKFSYKKVARQYLELLGR